MKIYIGIMDNGSGDAMIHTVSTDQSVALKRLQEAFLKWRKNAPEELESIADPSNPTLEEMSDRIPGYGAFIVIAEDGAKLYEELRNWAFEGCVRIGGPNRDDDTQEDEG